MDSYFIKNAKIIMKDSILSGYGVVVRGGEIAEICGNECGGDCKVIDADGLYLSPGFIDIHNHGNSGLDAMDATAQALDGISKFHIKNGVTGFLATTMTASPENTLSAVKNAVDFMQREYNGGSQLLGVYMEGPYFSKIKKGAQNEKSIADIDLKEIERYIEAGSGKVKVFALAPELPKSREAIHFLRERKITVSAGHSNATFAETMDGINNGITEATHIYNGMRNFSHREPGIIGACLTDARVCCEMICDGIHLHPAAMKMVVRTKGRDNVALISDSLRGNGMPDGEYINDGRVVTVKNNEIRLADGTLAGSTLSLNKAVKNMVEMVGVPLCDAVFMASFNPAKQIGEDSKKGSIEVGKDADIILFDEKINVKKVFVGGGIVYEHA